MWTLAAVRKLSDVQRAEELDDLRNCPCVNGWRLRAVPTWALLAAHTNASWATHEIGQATAHGCLNPFQEPPAAWRRRHRQIAWPATNVPVQPTAHCGT